MKQSFKRFLSFIISLVIAASMLPAPVFAAQGGQSASIRLAESVSTIISTPDERAVEIRASGQEFIAEIQAAQSEILNNPDYSAKHDEAWLIMDRGAYEKHNSSNKMSGELKQEFINKAAEDVRADKADASVISKNILALRSMGYSAENIKTADGEVLNAIKRLADIKPSDVSPYSAAYALMALGSEGDYLTDELKNGYISVIKSSFSSASGLCGYEWGGVYYADMDTTFANIAALAPYYGEADIKSLVDRAIAESQKAEYSSNFGNANTDAMAAIALAAIGVNPCDDYFVGGKNLGESLMGNYLRGKASFAWKANLDDSPNGLATEQGFRALISIERVITDGSAYNIYDFSQNARVQAVAKDAGGSGGNGGGGEDKKEITVSFTLKAYGPETWIAKQSVQLAKDSTVYDAFVKTLDANGYSYEGASSGYVKSITNPDGEKLSEFDKGINSGWKYSVNGIEPDIGLRDYRLKDGDEVLWYYTADYISGGGGGGGSNTAEEDETEENAAGGPSAADEEQREAGESITADNAEPMFTDVPADFWGAKYIEAMCSMGIVNGREDGSFGPDDKTLRSELVAMLSRLAGAPEGDYDGEFKDVSSEDWFGSYISWAARTGIVQGDGEGLFNPEDGVTRQDLAVILARFCKYMNIPLEGEGAAEFNDSGEIADYAREAVNALRASGVISGDENGNFNPNSQASRAEVAKMLYNIIEMIENK